MSTPNDYSSLAGKISDLATALDKYNRENGVQHPTFGEANWKEPVYPQQIEEIKTDLLDTCRELEDLVMGPQKLLQLELYPRQNYIDVIHKFDIAKRVPRNGKISYKELADSAQVDEAALKRMLRYAISHRVFHEKEPGFVSHSAASRLLVEEPAMFDWIGSTLRNVLPAVAKQAAAMQKWPNASGPTETAFALADESGSGSFWSYIAQNPGAAKEFAGGMTLFAKGEGYSARHVVDNYPWESLGSGTVVDLGGSVGDIAFAIAEKHPRLNLVVQDLPKTIEAARERPGVNVTFMAHDYFKEQPLKGADVYMARWVFHDTPNSDAIKILKALVPALKKGSRILLADVVMPASGALPNSEERWLRGMDAVMMALFNAHERELEEWKYLFSSADHRFFWKGITQPRGSKLALIEAVWDPDQNT